MQKPLLRSRTTRSRPRGAARSAGSRRGASGSDPGRVVAPAPTSGYVRSDPSASRIRWLARIARPSPASVDDERAEPDVVGGRGEPQEEAPRSGARRDPVEAAGRSRAGARAGVGGPGGRVCRRAGSPRRAPALRRRRSADDLLDAGAVADEHDALAVARERGLGVDRGIRGDLHDGAATEIEDTDVGGAGLVRHVDASRRPSGAHDGLDSDAGELVSLCGRPPRVRTTKRSPPAENAMRCPPGDQAGSAPRASVRPSTPSARSRTIEPLRSTASRRPSRPRSARFRRARLRSGGRGSFRPRRRRRRLPRHLRRARYASRRPSGDHAGSEAAEGRAAPGPARRRRRLRPRPPTSRRRASPTGPVSALWLGSRATA